MTEPLENTDEFARYDPFLEGLRAHFAANKSLKMSAISRQAGLDPSTVGKMLAGKVGTVHNLSAQKIAKALGTTVAALSGRAGARAPGAASPQTGFSDSQAEPWTPPPHAPSTDPIAFLTQGLRHPITYRLTRAAPSLALQAGDVVVLEMGIPPKDGDIILVGLVEGFDDKGGPRVLSLVRRFIGGFAVSADPGEVHPTISLENANASWRGTVRRMFRPAT